MIFSNQLYGKVLRGEKTQTRRLVSSSDQPVDMHGDKIPVDKYFPGKRIAVQKGRGIHGEGHIILTAVRVEPLGRLDYDAARAEGFRTRDDFATYWVELHDKAWLARAAKQAEAEAESLSIDAETFLQMLVLGRFDTRWEAKEVWVLTFTLDTSEQPLMLMQGSPLTDGGKARLMSNRKLPPGRAKSPTMHKDSPEARGYTQSGPRAMPREPEPVDAATQKLFAREGWQGWAAREGKREADREKLGTVERLQRLILEGRENDVDLQSHLASIERRIRSGEKKVQKRT